VFVFGNNDYGQLGLGHKNVTVKPSCVKSKCMFYLYHYLNQSCVLWKRRKKWGGQYRVFNHGGNGVLNEPRVARFSATTLHFPTSENADVR
jgi:hypothetical protein